MTDEPTIFFVRVWREGGFRASLRAVDQAEQHWFSAPEPLARWLVHGAPATPEEGTATPGIPHTGPTGGSE